MVSRICSFGAGLSSIMCTTVHRYLAVIPSCCLRSSALYCIIEQVCTLVGICWMTRKQTQQEDGTYILAEVYVNVERDWSIHEGCQNQTVAVTLHAEHGHGPFRELPQHGSKVPSKTAPFQVPHHNGSHMIGCTGSTTASTTADSSAENTAVLGE